MESMKVVTAQHAARAHELHEKVNAMHDQVEAVAQWWWNKIVSPAERTAQLVESAALCERSEKKSELSKEIMRARVQLRKVRHDMAFVQLQSKLDELKAAVEDLRTWQKMAPLLDSCPE
jgi:hypothetical protein